MSDPAELDALLDAAAYRALVEELDVPHSWHLVDDLDRPATRRGRWPPTSRCSTRPWPTARPGCGCTAGTRRRSRSDGSSPTTDVDVDACARLGVEVVRRPTGGRALLHGGDLTYAVALPARARRPASTRPTPYLAGGLLAGLARLGVTAAIARHEGPAGAVCFATQQGADLRVGDRKVCGSAQVQRGAGVLQHGSILLDRLAFDETDLVMGDHDRAALRGCDGHPGRARRCRTTRESWPTRSLAGFVAALDLDFTVAPASLTSTSSEG